jgi:aspartyl-tRNA(Asn)/glutamyl-tRNA(Gln) amidotransferase subunit C
MLTLTEEEKSLFAQQLNTILEYINKLNELDTTDVEPTSHVLSLKNVYREDISQLSLSHEEALNNAPDPSEGFYRVPKIIT